jgi:hypothetical protein
MKYLRHINKYKLFESNNFEDIKLDMSDILLDISDIGYSIEIIDRKFPSHLEIGYVVEEIKIFIEKGSIKYLPTEEFIEPLKRLCDFAISNGFGYSIDTIRDSRLVNFHDEDFSGLTDNIIDYIRILFQRKNR